MANEGVGVGAGAGGEGTGTGAGAGSGTGTAGTGAGSGTGTGTGSSSAGTGTGRETTGYTYKEDRSDWFPKHRYDEVNARYDAAETARKDLESKLAAADARVRALAGVEPTDPGQAKIDAVRANFSQVFPELAWLLELSPEEREALRQAPNAADTVRQQELRGWTKHGDSAVDYLSERIADAYGADKLSAEQATGVRNNFSNWLQAKIQPELDASQGRESATLARYERGDNALYDEFVKDFTKQWVEPARRTAVAGQTSRIRAVPDSRGRGQVTSTLQKPGPDASLDDRIAFAAKRFQELGGRFDR